METIEQKKKNFISALGFTIVSIANSETLSEKDETLVYDIIKGLKQIILKQEEKGVKNNLKKILDKEEKILIALYSIIKNYNKKKKGDLINLWNDLERLYKPE